MTEAAMTNTKAKPHTQISIVVAAAENNVIGHMGDMPWRSSADLKNFKKLTTGKPVIMGRKTYDSIGKPLPNRRNIVVTRNADWAADGVETCPSLESALALAKSGSNIAETMVVGGGELYAQALRIADQIYLTRISARPDGDTWFPALSTEIWQLISTEPLERKPKDTVDAVFEVHKRRPVL